MELSNHRKKIADLEDFLDAMKVHEGLTQGTLAGKYFKGTLECVHLEKQNLNFPSLSLATCQYLPFFAILIPVWLLITVSESVNPVGQILSRFLYISRHISITSKFGNSIPTTKTIPNNRATTLSFGCIKTLTTNFLQARFPFSKQNRSST